MKSMMAQRARGWDNWKLGAGGTPIKIYNYWLVFITASVWSVCTVWVLCYLMKTTLSVLYRSHKAILAPKRDYERFGKVPNVVFSCGNVVIGDELYVHYCTADSVIGVTKVNLEKLLPSFRQ